MNDKTDFSQCNIIEGEIKESKTDIENLNDFIKRWEVKIKELKNLCLNNQQSYSLASDYLIEWNKFMYGEEPKNRHVILNQLSHDLFLAITQANNNYRKQFPSFWQNVHKLKLPDLHFHK